MEIDVLTAMALGMSLEQLKSIYKIQFPVLQSYEADTWYDQKGRIIFTTNKGLSNVGLSREEWNKVKEMKMGVYLKTITDDTLPGGPVERVIEYVAPFDRCDREQDYETAWKFFEEKYGTFLPESIRRQGTLHTAGEEYIRRDYKAADVPEPDLIYGWDNDRSRCKPSPYPLEEIMRITGCGPEELLMVDDLKPGLDMAHACGVKFAACRWSYDIPVIREYMKKNADYSLGSVAELEKLQFGEEAV